MILGVLGFPQLLLILLILALPIGIILLISSRAKHKGRAEAYKEIIEKNSSDDGNETLNS